MRTLAIIPARGGSKGVPRKNIKMLAGKPLIAYTIEQAKESKYIDEVVVSTDDLEIKEIAKTFLATVVDRPKELATDMATTELVIEHVLNKIMGYGCIVLLQCTSPFRTTEDIDNAIEMYMTGKYASVFSAKESDAFLWVKNGNYVSPINFFDKERPMRQQMEQYEENGAVYVFGRRGFENYKTRLYGFKGMYIMPEERSLEIDTEEDFKYASWRKMNE